MAEQSNSPEQLRRSPRQETELSVRVQGTLRDGQKLNEPAQVNQMSSHGIRLTMQKAIPNGLGVEIQFGDGRPATRYRVVWCMEDSAAGGWQLGMELVDGGGASRDGFAGPPTGTGTVYE